MKYIKYIQRGWLTIASGNLPVLCGQLVGTLPSH